MVVFSGMSFSNYDDKNSPSDLTEGISRHQLLGQINGLSSAELDPTGELTIETADAFRQTCTQLLDSGVARFFVGLGNLHYIDSTGLGSLVRLNREVKARDGTLHFYNPAPPVRDIFELTHLDKVLDIDETRKAAFDKADKK
jgi:anti-sigma B factor antagonist